MGTEKTVVVTVSDAALENIQSVADELAAKGLKVDRVLKVTGVITGSCPTTKKASLRSVDGVQSVEEEAEVHLAPPDSDAQ